MIMRLFHYPSISLPMMHCHVLSLFFSKTFFNVGPIINESKKGIFWDTLKMKSLQHHKDKSNKLTSNVGLVAKVQQCPLIVYEQFRAAKCKVALKKDLYSRTKKKRIYYRVCVLSFNFYQIQAGLYCQVFLCYSMMMLLEKFWTKEILENQWITRAGKLTYSDPCSIVIVFIIINIIDHHLSYHLHQSHNCFHLN